MKSENVFLDQKLVVNLLTTSSWINEKVNDFFKKYELSQQQYNVLRILRGKKGVPANLSDIQQRMISPMSNTTRLIEKLRQKELVTRYECKENRRKIEILITKRGLQLLNTIDPVLIKYETEILKQLEVPEKQQLEILLNKLRTKQLK